MDRAEAIEQIELFLDMEKLGGAIEAALKMAITALREQEQREWISVSERLPDKTNADEKGLVIAIAKGELPKLWYWDLVVRYKQEFTHWMPLPEPPTEGGDSDG